MSDDKGDPLQDLFSDFEDIAGGTPSAAPSETPARKSGRRGRPSYRSALDESRTNRRSAAKVTGKKATVAGQYMRRSFTFRPDQLDSIDEVASQLGLSKNDLMRWFVDMGLDAVAQGEEPPISEEIRHRYDPGGE